MKTLKIIAIALLINSSLFSQSIDSLSISKKRRMLNVEIVSTAGLKYDGIFISADDKKTVFYNKTNSNFLSIANNDIYEIKLKRKYTFGKSFGYNMIAFSIISSELIMPLFDGDAIMIPPSFLVGFASTLFGVPTSLLVSKYSRNRDHIDIDYVIDENNSYDIVKPFLQKNNKTFLLKNVDTIKEIISIKDTLSLKKRLKPQLNKHPLYVNKVHLSLGTSATFDNIEKEFIENLKSSDFNDKIYDDNNFTTSRFNIGLSLNLKDNIRLYSQYASKNSMSQIGGRTIADDAVYLESYYSTLGVGIEYVFKPTNKLLLKKYEFSLKAGIENNFLDYKIWYSRADSETNSQTYYKIVNKKYNIPSIELGGSFNYYISRNMSFKASLVGSAMLPYKYEGIEDMSVSGDKVSTGEIKVNVFSFKPMIGIEFSL